MAQRRLLIKSHPRREAPRTTFADPTRTGGLRRQFVAELRRQFSSLKADLLRAARDETMVANVFCPTGEGGGVDPTCRPSNVVGGVDYSLPKEGGYVQTSRGSVEYFVNPSKQELAKLIRESGGNVRALADSVRIVAWDAEKALHHEMSDALGHKGMKALFIGNDFTRQGSLTLTFHELAFETRATTWKEDWFVEHPYIRRFQPRNDLFSVKLSLNELSISGWFEDRVRQTLLSFSQERLWGLLVDSAFRRGASRSYEDVMGNRHNGIPEFDRRSREGFLTALMSQGMQTDQVMTENALFSRLRSAFDTVKALAKRAWDEFTGGVRGMVQGVQRAATDGVLEGKTPQQVVREAVKVIDKGFEQAKGLVQTEVTRAHAKGQLVGFVALGVREVGVLVEWRVVRNPDGTIDSKVCPSCRAMEGVVLKISEADGLIPLHPRCLPGDSLVLSRSRITATSERWYDGDLIVISTASGRELSCTPNHPILTDRGWVAAERLDLGDKVVCDGGSEWESLRYNDHKDVPTSIHDIAKAFRGSRDVVTSKVPVSAPDFHGDGKGSEIAVIRSNSLLRDGRKSAKIKERFQFSLVTGDVMSGVGFASNGSLAILLDRDDPSLSSCVCGSDQVRSLKGIHLRPTKDHRIRTTSDRYSSEFKNRSDSLSSSLESQRDRLFRLSSNVTRDGVRHIEQSILPSSKRLDLPPENVHDDAQRDVKLSRKIRSGDTGPVFLDQVVSTFRREFHGHVYNLETREGFYAANGIITHNCRCSFSKPRIDAKGQKRNKGDIDKAIAKARARRRLKPGQGWAAKTRIAQKRPTITTNHHSLLSKFDELTRNVFCPTGKGGGVDPTCSPNDSWRSSVKDSLKKGIKVFRGVGRGQSNDYGAAGKGRYYSGSKQVAEAYGKIVEEDTISLNNPYIASYSELTSLQESLYGRPLTGFEKDLSEKFDQYLKSNGYDGVALFDFEISKIIPQEVVRLGRPKIERTD